MNSYKFVEVPLVGYTLAKNPWTFGYKEIFNKDYKVDVFLSDNTKIDTLESLVSAEAKKGKFKTLIYGIGTAGTAATASSAVASILGLICSGGACPMWLGAMFSALTPLAWIPIAASGGFVVAKRLGGRKGLRYLKDSFPGEIKRIDYSPIEGVIKERDLEAKTLEYYASKLEGTRREKLKRMFKKNPELKQLKKDLKDGFQELTEKSYEMLNESEEKEVYLSLHKTYKYITKGFKGNMFRTKGSLIFGV